MGDAMKAILAALSTLLLATSLSHADTVLNVGVVSRTIFYLPAWTAIHQGFFKQEGLDVCDRPELAGSTRT